MNHYNAARGSSVSLQSLSTLCSVKSLHETTAVCQALGENLLHTIQYFSLLYCTVPLTKSIFSRILKAFKSEGITVLASSMMIVDYFLLLFTLI